MIRGWRRRFHRFWRRGRGDGVVFVHDPAYQRAVFGVALDPLRGEKILVALREQGLLRRGRVAAPRPVTFEDLLRVHTVPYLQSLQEGETLTRILGVELPAAEAEGVVQLQRLVVGGTIHATRLALREGAIACHLGGGFHHAGADAGAGFCVFNDVAVAIARLRARGYAERILVADLDLHDGNGTRALFARDASVHTFSIHNADWGETEAVESTSIALGPSVGDARYLQTLRGTLPPVVAAFRPGLVFYLAGTDGAEDDALGNWKLSADALRQRDQLVTGLVRGGGARVPTVVLLAGGYGRGAWRHSARFLLWLASGRELEPIGDDEVILSRARRVTEGLANGGPADLDFALSQDELPGLSPGLPPPHRFLGRLSLNTVELHLERLGILGQLRSKGFRRLRVDASFGSGLGDTLRVLCEDLPAPGELLVELRARRSSQAVPGMEMLVVEWLLLQNPRAAFTDRRPSLPGQQHPGLGLLKDVLGWLIALCESLGLDGVHFVAAHYHVAMQSRQRVHFLRPEDAARTEALSRALAGLTLAEATAALAAGQVRSRPDGARADWQPAPMALPASARLSEQVSGPDYDESVAAAASAFRFYRVSEVPR